MTFQVCVTVSVTCEVRVLLFLFLAGVNSPPVLGVAHCRKTAICLRGLVVYYQIKSKRNSFPFTKPLKREEPVLSICC